MKFLPSPIIDIPNKRPVKPRAPHRKMKSSEGMEHIRAFEHYLTLGEDRSYEKVAEYIGKSVTTIAKWSNSYKWVERVKEAERALVANLSSSIETLDEQIAKKKLHLQIIDTILKGTVEVDADGNVKKVNISARNTADIKTLLEARDRILGVKQGDSSTIGGARIQNAMFILKR